jgi:diguanylate cyclase (GGDEF)-like protein
VLFASQAVLLLAVVQEPLPLRVTVVSLSHAVLVLPMLGWLLRARAQHTAMMWMVFASLAVSEAMLVFRAMDAWVFPQYYLDLGGRSWRQGLVYSASYLFLFGGGFGFALANLDRLAGRLQELASVDPLTGCLNRRAASERLQEVLAQPLRPHAALTLVLLDLDHFKQVNDRHGHHCGDRALLHFATLARREGGEGALLSRLGGEEFALWLPGQDALVGAQRADRLRRAVANGELRDAEGQRVALTVSAGVASVAVGSDEGAAALPVDLGALYTAADRALYRAKADGRNRVEIDEASDFDALLAL